MFTSEIFILRLNSRIIERIIIISLLYGTTILGLCLDQIKKHLGKLICIMLFIALSEEIWKTGPYLIGCTMFAHGTEL